MSGRTKEWKVEGLLFKTRTMRMRRKEFFVRYTSDEIGKSLSIADEVNGIMFQVPFDEIYKAITGGES